MSKGWEQTAVGLSKSITSEFGVPWVFTDVEPVTTRILKLPGKTTKEIIDSNVWVEGFKILISKPISSNLEMNRLSWCHFLLLQQDAP